MQIQQFAFLASRGLIEHVTIFCGPEGVELWIGETDHAEVPLHTARGHKRVFASIDTAAKFLVNSEWVGEGRLREWVGEVRLDISERWGVHREKETSAG